MSTILPHSAFNVLWGTFYLLPSFYQKEIKKKCLRDILPTVATATSWESFPFSYLACLPPATLRALRGEKEEEKIGKWMKALATSQTALVWQESPLNPKFSPVHCIGFSCRTFLELLWATQPMLNVKQRVWLLPSQIYLQPALRTEASLRPPAERQAADGCIEGIFWIKVRLSKDYEWPHGLWSPWCLSCPSFEGEETQFYKQCHLGVLLSKLFPRHRQQPGTDGSCELLRFGTPHKVFVTFVPSPFFFLYLFICSSFSVSFFLLISPFLSILPFLFSVFSRGRWGREACWHHSLFLSLPASCPMFFLLNPTFLTHSPRHICSCHTE